MQARHGHRPTIRGGRLCVVAALTCTATLAAAYGGARWSARWTAERLEAELTAASDASAQSVIDRLTAIGPAGIVALVRASGSDREVLARAARTALVAELARWETLADEAAYERLKLLADSLAAEVGGFDASARAFAKDLVLRMLVWRRRGARDDREKLIAACERILRIDLLAPLSVAATSSIARSAAHSDADSAQRSTAMLAGQTPEAGIESPRVLAAEVLANGATALPRLAPLPPAAVDWSLDGAAPVDVHRQPRALREHAASDERPSSGDLASEASADLAARYETAAPREAAADPGAAEALEQFDAFALFARLGEGDLSAAGAARAELTRRGFGAGEIEIGRHLTSADALERLQWVEVLPRAPGLDAKPWLLRLSRDADARVRAVAATLMATTNDPDLLARLRQMATDDDDARVVEQASRRWR